ncbi:MAG: hypothetical protein ACI9RM_001524 [Ulvibacter sp.]|jgi:hypothetical protein
MKSTTIFFLLFVSFCSFSQETKRVLFIGNSYTYYNDLPDLLSQAASSAGDVVIHDSNTPPNVSWQDHVDDLQTSAKIMQGNWDYVALQEAGRATGFSDQWVMENVYPYANELNDLIEEYNPCGETLFYLTWGELNGVPSICPTYPPFCNYEEMDDLIRLRHLIMAENYEAEVSPVGAVWRYLHVNHPGIDLYEPDGYHPSLIGSYVGAITFYTSIFRKDPNLVSFNSTLSPTLANTIREAVRLVVYDNLSTWFIGSHDPAANYSYSSIGIREYQFVNTSMFSNNYLWNFGDGLSSTDENPIHQFADDGIYTVTLTTNFFCANASSKSFIINTLGIDDSSIESYVSLYPNPTDSKINLEFSEKISGTHTFTVFSVSGQKVAQYQEMIKDGRISLSSDQLSPGMYFLKISIGGSTIEALKFLKN